MMLASWSISLMLFSVTMAGPLETVQDIGANLVPVNAIITSVNSYFKDSGQVTLPLLDISPPFSLLRITNGTIGMFNTIQLQGDSVFKVVPSKEGTIKYLYDVSLGLNPLQVHYDIEVNLLKVVKKGGVTITPQKNTLRVQGSAVVGTEGRCSAELTIFEITHMEDYKIKISPDDFPFIDKTYQTILNFVVPKLLKFGNFAIKTAGVLPSLNKKFGGLVCKKLSVANNIN